MANKKENKVENKVDVIVIGGGSGGLSFSAAAAQMGAKVILVERAKMGGDCLNYGCVPSKALLAASHAAYVDHAKAFGVTLKSQVNFPHVQKHVKSVIESIAPNDSVERFEGLGVHVIQGEASFISANKIKVGKKSFEAKYFVIATGSSPFVPPIEGLNTCKYFTNENIFENAQAPKKLAIIGGGPIGIEMAQAHAQLGIKVVVIDLFEILPRETENIRTIIREKLIKLGVEIQENTKSIAIKKLSTSTTTTQDIQITLRNAQNKRKTIKASHILVATGRKPNLKSLNLEAAGVVYHRTGIQTNARLQSSRKHIYAIGDCAGSYQFTHIANYHASVAIRNILLKIPAKVDYSAVPWVTYTDPEIAHVGMTAQEIASRYKNYKVLDFPFSEIDRAQAERKCEGLIQVYLSKKNKILGVDIVGAHAGELIQPWCLAIQENLPIRAMASYIAPYPTFGEINKRVAGSLYAKMLFSPFMKRIVRFLLSLRR